MRLKSIIFIFSFTLGAAFAAEKHLVVEEAKDQGPVKARGIISLEEKTFNRIQKLPPGSRIRMKKKPASKRGIDQTLKTYYSQSFLKIEGETDTNRKGSIESDSIPGFGVVWTPWREGRTQLGISYSFQSVHFAPSQEREVINNDQELQRYAIGANYKLTNSLIADAYLGMADQLFFRSLDANTVKVNAILVPFAQLGLNYNVLKMKRFIVSAKGSARIHLPFERDPYEGEGGTGLQGSLSLNYGMRNFLLSLEGFGSTDTFKFPDNEFTRSEVGVSIGVILPIGGDL